MSLLHISLLLLAFMINKSSGEVFLTHVAPLYKQVTNSSQPFYTITLNFHENYIIDLESPFSWFSCGDLYPYPVSGDSPQCYQARNLYMVSPLCPPSNSTSAPRRCVPCGDCWGDPFECEDPFNRCAVTSLNPITKSCQLSQLSPKDIIIYWTDGRNPVVAMDYGSLILSCAPPSLLKGIPENIIGLASLSWSPLSLISDFTSTEVKKKFAICLPSSSKTPGVAFFGDGLPYYILPNKSVDARTILSYTPLFNRSKLPFYYIQVNGISINRNALPVSVANSSVKLSTIVPYTTLRSDIYAPLVKKFTKVIKTVLQVKAVSPFSLCINSSSEHIGHNKVGLRVPRINLQLANGSVWEIYGPNSMKVVAKDVACLAFIDGGQQAEDAIVIGSFQMENNLLFFDLEKSILGFSSTLLLEKTTCSNFNFTATM